MKSLKDRLNEPGKSSKPPQTEAVPEARRGVKRTMKQTDQDDPSNLEDIDIFSSVANQILRPESTGRKGRRREEDEGLR